MDAILRDSLLDTRIRMRFLISVIVQNVIVPNLEYAGDVWEGDTKLAKHLETEQMTVLQKDAQIQLSIL